MDGWFKIITPPAASQVVTRTEMKAHLRVDHSSEDDLIDFLLAEAEEAVASDCRVVLLDTVTELYLDNFPYSQAYANRQTLENVLATGGVYQEIILKRRPVSAINSIKYYDSDNVLQTLATSVYETDLIGPHPRIRPKVSQNWPATYSRYNAIVINFNEGYANVAAIPKGIKQLIRLKVAGWYENRSAITDGRSLAELPDPLSYKALRNRLVVRAL